MEFNGKQLAAIVKAAKAIADADGHIDKREADSVIAELMSFGIGQDDLLNYMKFAEVLDAPTMFSALCSMSSSQKKYVSGFLAHIMVRDGQVWDSEMSLWRFITSLIGSPFTSHKEALDYWRLNK